MCRTRLGKCQRRNQCAAGENNDCIPYHKCLPVDVHASLVRTRSLNPPFNSCYSLWFCVLGAKSKKNRRSLELKYLTLTQAGKGAGFEIDTPTLSRNTLPRRDCAPTPNTLPAALLPSSFRQQKISLRFSLLRHIGLMIAVNHFLKCLRNRCCCGVLAAIGACSCRGTVVCRLSIDRDPDRGRDAQCSSTLTRSRLS